MTRYALAYPHVRFQLYQDGKIVLQTTGSGNRREVLAHLYGVDTARQMLEVVQDEEGLRLTGFTSPVSLTRSNRRDITFFINGRWVQDVALNSALVQAYHTYLMVGRYPLAALFIQLPPEEVDVNVHPAKAEVRFRHPDVVFSAVQRSVRRALLAYSPVPTLSGPAWHLPPTANNPDPAWEMTGDLKDSSTFPDILTGFASCRNGSSGLALWSIAAFALGRPGWPDIFDRRRPRWIISDRPTCRP